MPSHLLVQKMSSSGKAIFANAQLVYYRMKRKTRDKVIKEELRALELQRSKSVDNTALAKIGAFIGKAKVKVDRAKSNDSCRSGKSSSSNLNQIDSNYLTTESKPCSRTNSCNHTPKLDVRRNRRNSD